jgi:cytoskeletal protein RodZ
MTSIGDTLRRERLRRNLELAQIADDLRISTRFLQAIETDQFNKLPGGVFTKSFVRQYATYLGLDPREMVAEVQRAVEPEGDGPEFREMAKPDVPGITVGIRDSWRSISERRSPLPSWMTSGLILVGLMLVCSGIYWWWERPRHQMTAATPLARVTAPPAARPAADAVVSQPHATPGQPATALPEPSATDPASPPAAAPNPNASVRVAIVADELVWISATVNGKYLLSGTLKPHESRNIDADGEVKLRVGNAGGVTLMLNGKPVGEVGPKGQPRTVQFTSRGFEIVSLPRSLEPLERL